LRIHADLLAEGERRVAIAALPLRIEFSRVNRKPLWRSLVSLCASTIMA
jgi:hypothetical protein